MKLRLISVVVVGLLSTLGLVGLVEADTGSLQVGYACDGGGKISVSISTSGAGTKTTTDTSSYSVTITSDGSGTGAGDATVEATECLKAQSALVTVLGTAHTSTGSATLPGPNGLHCTVAFGPHAALQGGICTKPGFTIGWTSVGTKTGGRGWAATAGSGTAVGQRSVFVCPPNGTVHQVWGTGTYASNSSVCTAAVQAGLIDLGQGGNVTIQSEPGLASYAASSHNGISSKPHGRGASSFWFIGVRKF